MSEPRDHAATRGRQFRRTTATAVVARALALGTQLVTVPLLVGTLGSSGYGVWSTIASLGGWMGTVNLGVVPALIQLLSADRKGRDDTAMVATAFWVQTVLALVVCAIAATLWLWAPWARLLGSDDPAAAALAGGFIWILAGSIAVGLPFSVAAGVLSAQQRGDEVQRAQLVATAAMLGSMLLARLLGAPPLLLPALMVFVPISASIWLWYRLRGAAPLIPPPYGASREALDELVGTGRHFVVIGIAAVLISGTDALVISLARGSDAVAPYSATMALTQLLPMVTMLPLNAAWPAYVEAAGRRDIGWVTHTHRRLTTITWIGAAGWLAAATVGAPVVAAWSGIDVGVDRWLVVVCAFAACIQAVSLPPGRLLTALGGAHLNARFGMANAVLNLVLSVALVGPLGVHGVALGTALAYCVTSPIVYLLAHRALRRIGKEAV